MTRLDEVYVGILLGAVIIATGLILRLRPPARRLRQGYVLAAVIGYAALLYVWLTDFELYALINRDHHVIEWATAHFLIVAAVLYFTMMVRGVRRRAPASLACFFAAGFFTAFCRELEFGEPFLPRRIWYSRHLFRPHLWFDRVYWEGFLQGLGVDERLSVDDAIRFNVSISGFAILFGLAVSLYLLKHRRRFVQELTALHQSAFGRWFLLGLGLYVGAQLIEHAMNLLPGSSVSPFAESEDAAGISRLLNYRYMRSVDEPLECLGAAAFWISSLTMWMRLGKRVGGGPGDVAEDAHSDSRVGRETTAMGSQR